MTLRWVLASGNRGKLAEFQRRLKPVGIELVPQSELGVKPAAETGSTFADNALLKAEHAARTTGLPALADDSGLEVAALDQRPGVHSARYAGDHATDDQNIDKLLEALAGKANRSARFRCVLALVRPGTVKGPVLFEGVWNGVILHQRQGEGGFGYDPVFYVPDAGASAAELPIDVKNEISHRGQAMRELIDALVGGRIPAE